MNSPNLLPRNPGPSWGYRFLLWAEHGWPQWLFRPALMAGTWVGLVFMTGQRAHSRSYLAVVLGRPARLTEVWRHFFAFAEFLVLSLRAGQGAPVRCQLEGDHAAAFDALIKSGQAALFGTFHVGASDLLGYLLSERGRHVTIIRQQVANSDDTQFLGERYGGRVSFLWVNDPATLLFELKAALDAGESLALKCDRLQFSARAETFDFLGARRQFPFTIYHLAVLFDRPVVFCTAVSEGTAANLRVHASPVFRPNQARDREENLRVARQHFQSVLAHLEGLLRQHPYLWFNFLPLNPEEPRVAA